LKQEFPQKTEKVSWKETLLGAEKSFMSKIEKVKEHK
jgi:hypothetical protein